MPIPTVPRKWPATTRSGLPVDLGTLAFGVLGAPLAWSLQLLLGCGLAAHACFPKTVPLAVPVIGAERPWLAGISLAALLLGAMAGAVAWRNWRRLRRVPGDGMLWARGPGHGRVLSLALAGLVSSLLFLVAVFLTTDKLLAVSLCG